MSLTSPAKSEFGNKLLSGDGGKGLFYCSLLALQFGLQPMIASRFTSPGASKSTVVIATELSKIGIAALSIASEDPQTREKIYETWTIRNSLKIAALPAVLYAIQNVMVQHAYVLLDSMTFNLLNQTKTLSAAIFLYFIMGQKQSVVQIFALFLLFGAALVLNMGDSVKETSAASNYNLGLAMVAGASLLSGLSTALTQRALVGATSVPRHALFFSAELAVYGIVFLVLTLIFSDEGRNLVQKGVLTGWTPYMLIPVVSNAFGGVVVGLVTKYAGGVVKGFALIAGIIVTAFAQWALENKSILPKHWIAVALVSISIYLHNSFPVRNSSTPRASNKPTEMIEGKEKLNNMNKAKASTSAKNVATNKKGD